MKLNIFIPLIFKQIYEIIINYGYSLKIINGPYAPNNTTIKFLPNGFIEGTLWSINEKNQQGIIYTKNGNLFIDKIGATQDRCKFIEKYRVKLDKNKIIMIQYGGITSQKMVFEYTKVE